MLPDASFCMPSKQAHPVLLRHNDPGAHYSSWDMPAVLHEDVPALSQ